MSEEQKMDTAKTSLPTKTKTAVVLLIAFGIIGAVSMIFVLLFSSISGGDSGTPIYLFIGLGFLYIIPAILIYIKNRIAWIFAVVILAGVIISFFIYILIRISSADSYSGGITVFVALLVILIPLILLILDRKNYFEMVRQREMEKKL